ncbi:MAG: hypothetical protein A2341_21335 [Deltaproteobacteria bacterium RIFOXYB12_FULL_58_9]|nr:MAG: hypothetical protein A2341_21335 [Deltaproteobacteria bacterium RIFOXYB12_FULL_58_9]
MGHGFHERFDGAKLLVVLSDGSDWIRSLAAWLPVKTLLILDLYHVKHRIFEVAHAVFGEHSQDARDWAEAQGDRIEAGNARHVIEALSFPKPRGKQTRKLVDDLAGYLTIRRCWTKSPLHDRPGSFVNKHVGILFCEFAEFFEEGFTLRTHRRCLNEVDQCIGLGLIEPPVRDVFGGA